MGRLSRKVARTIARRTAPKVLRLTPAQQAEVDAKFAEMDRQDRERRGQFGKVRPIITAKFKGKRVVAVGSTLYWQDEGKWKTFPDFLIAHMWSALGADWGKSEIAKPEADRHQILKWKKAHYDFTRTVKVDDDGTYRAQLDDESLAYFALAYDIYIVRDNAELQRRLVERLKHPDQFQGARYELTVTATFIRAGFKIAFEVETDGSMRHNEFVATQPATGQKLVLEAKSRQRRGILGFGGGKLEDRATMKVGIRGLLEDALSKPAPHPRVVFIDINFPPERLVRGPALDGVIEELRGVVAAAQREDDTSDWNIIMFTNLPVGYTPSGEPAGSRFAYRVTANRPRLGVTHPAADAALDTAMDQFGNIPNEFPPNR